MTYDEYWNGSAELVVFYRKKSQIEQKRKNQEMWLQGLYMFRAVETVAYNLHREKGAEVKQYLDKPIPITDAEALKQQEEAEQKELQRAKTFFANWVGANRREN